MYVAAVVFSSAAARGTPLTTAWYAGCTYTPSAAPTSAIVIVADVAWIVADWILTATGAGA
jgi:hypothetical protein